MTTINLHTFKGKNFHDIYIFIMEKREISFRLIIPREKDFLQQDLHFINSMEFGCAAYAAHQLNQVATDFSYTVPSPYKSKPFEFFIETTEPEKFADVVYMLLCVFNKSFKTDAYNNFEFEASQYFVEVLEGRKLEAVAYGLVAIAYKQLKLFRAIQTSN